MLSLWFISCVQAPPVKDSTPVAEAESDTETDTDTDGDADSDTDTDADTDTDSDGDTDADSDTDADTERVAYRWGQSEVTVKAGAFVSGREGMAWRSDDGNVLCEVAQQYTYLGPAPAGCPDCEWAFAVDRTGPVEWIGDCKAVEEQVYWIDTYVKKSEREYYEPEYYGYSAYAVSRSGRPMAQVIWWMYYGREWVITAGTYLDDGTTSVEVGGGTYRWWGGGGDFPVYY